MNRIQDRDDESALTTLRSFLLCETPDGWLERAVQNEKLLLIDHANCEKKAASTAMNLMYKYVDHGDLMMKLSKLAREELRHFEQVLAIIRRRDYSYDYVPPARYASGLRKLVRTWEPARLVDILITGAVVEARSCERFARLVGVMDVELSEFYNSLLKSEARHFKDYLDYAARLSNSPGLEDNFDDRVQVFLEADRELVTSADVEFRFHSGLPSGQ